MSDVPSCGGVKYAQEQGIATLTYPASKKGLFPGLTAEELVQQLTGEQLAADYVLLAGYLKVNWERVRSELGADAVFCNKEVNRLTHFSTQGNSVAL